MNEPKPKTRLDLIKDLKKLFEGKEKYLEEESDEIPKAERQGIIDRESIILIVPKKKWLLNAIKEVFNIESSVTEPIKTLDYTIDYEKIKKLEIASNYNYEYLRKVMDLCKNYEAIKLKMLRDYPLYIETKDFDLVLAPRVDRE